MYKRVHVRSAIILAAAAFTSVSVLSTGLAASGGTSAGDTGTPERMNVILVLTDDQSMKSIRHMPYLTSEPGGSWITFENAFLSTPLCCPSRAAILTGQYAFRSGVITNNGNSFDDAETLPLWLQDSGYHTGLIGKYMNHFLTGKDPMYEPPGWDDWQVLVTQEEAGYYYNYELNNNGDLESYGFDPSHYSTDVLSAKTDRFIAEAAGGIEPFFLFLAFNAPHGPSTPAPRHVGLLSEWEPQLDPNFNEKDLTDKPRWIRYAKKASPKDAREDYRNEAEAMQSVDESLESVVRTLIATGSLDDTVIIFMTDNGLSRGQHRYYKADGSKKCAYEECIRTPLLIRYPGATSQTVSEFVSNIDIAPTIQEIAGATSTLTQDGRSLLPLILDQPVEWRNHVLIDWRGNPDRVPRYRAVRTKRWKYVHYYDEFQRELYDLKNDPYELENLAREDRYKPLIERLDRKLTPILDPTEY